MRILFTGGGTGGHFFPVLAVIRETRRIAEEERILDLQLYYMGSAPLVPHLLRDESVRMIAIASGKMRRYFSLWNIVDAFRTFTGIVRAVWNMFLLLPDVIFSKGGYDALPAMVAARILGIPVVIHESDAIPGRVNKFAGRFARRIAVSFVGASDYFPANKTALVGVPIRKRILGGSLAAAQENFGVFSGLPVIGIVGGSQGAQKINETVLGVLKELTDEFEVVHQAGAKNLEETDEQASVILEKGHRERYHPIGFLDEQGMRDFYLIATLIISRAGAGSIFEIAAWGRPAILIPLKSAAQDHQRANAYEYAGSGGAVIIEEENITPHLLLSEIKKAMTNPELLRHMTAGAQKFSRINAAEIVAREILKIGMHGAVLSSEQEMAELRRR